VVEAGRRRALRHDRCGPLHRMAQRGRATGRPRLRPDRRGLRRGCPTPYNVFQTSLAGVFAVGDVRSGSVKRVASAVGEGSVVVQAFTPTRLSAGGLAALPLV